MNSTSKIVDIEHFMEIAELWHKQNDKIVFTNGCFDILHLGHIDYLEKAKALGDRLVVGLNTDSSVSLIKGAGRPINDQESRARILAALAFVDSVILFDEETPYELIKQVKPDILVKGNDYLAENIVGADIVKENGGEVVTIDLVSGYSTSKIIDKIKGLN